MPDSVFLREKARTGGEETMALAYDAPARTEAAEGPSVAILGAGVAGICTAIKLKEKVGQYACG